MRKVVLASLAASGLAMMGAAPPKPLAPAIRSAFRARILPS
ncbi:MAG TPA: hypothetical protein VIJ35_29715 [Bradyrhizobium sp.]